MTHHFHLQHEEHGGASAMRVCGDLDIAAADQFRRMVGDLMGSGVRVVTVDLAETEFLDSTGLGALLWAEHRLRAAGGDLVVVHARGPVARTFSMAGLASLLAH